MREVEPVPDHGPDHCEYASKAVRPVRAPCLETQQQIHQQRRPKLPADGLLGVAEEVADLQGRFDLLKKDLDGPTALVESTDTGSGPIHVVGNKNHLDLFAVDLDPGDDPGWKAEDER